MLRIFLYHRKVMFCSQDIQGFAFSKSHDLPAHEHDEHETRRMRHILNISFEPQVVKSPILAN